MKSSSKILGFLGFLGATILAFQIILTEPSIAFKFWFSGLLFSGFLVGNKTWMQTLEKLPLVDISKGIIEVVKGKK